MERAVLMVASMSIFAVVATGAVCSVLASTGGVTTGAEAVAMAATGAVSLLLIAAAYVWVRQR